jgi:isoprenylcysteine carboxyl methyltransferase (ICMT) family protein YpbQ
MSLLASLIVVAAFFIYAFYLKRRIKKENHALFEEIKNIDKDVK